MEAVGAALSHEPFFVGAQFLYIVLGAAFALKFDRIEMAVFHAFFEQNVRPAHLLDGVDVAHPVRSSERSLVEAALNFFKSPGHCHGKLLLNVLHFLLTQRNHPVEILISKPEKVRLPDPVPNPFRLVFCEV